MPIKRKIYTVAQINKNVDELIKTADFARNVSVKGKLIKWDYYRPQDAYYFTLEDPSGIGKLDGVLFNQSDKELPEDIGKGLPTVVKGYLELYSKGGTVRIRTTDIAKDEEREADEDFETRYERLKNAGYFDRKRPIPKMPAKICIITSPDGDAIHDFEKNIERRWPIAEILFIPSAVSTANAVRELISAFKTANTTDADMILFGRGGGDKEEIDKVFNSVELADAIRSSRIPTVSAVGHEENHTIADFAADTYVSTPTGAAVTVPDKDLFIKELEEKKKTFGISLNRVVDRKIAAVQVVNERIKARSPRQKVAANGQKLEAMNEKMRLQLERLIERKSSECDARYSMISMRGHALFDAKERKLLHTAEMIEALSPLAVLTRGYSITYRGEKAVKSAGEVNTGDKLRIRLADGALNVVAESIEKEQKL